jgi:hypothetical protein
VDFEEDLREVDAGEARDDRLTEFSKLGGSSSLSSPVSVRVSRPFTDSIRTAALVEKCAAVR